MNPESTYRLIFENSYYGILVVQEGFVRFSNPVILSITGYSFNDLILRPVITFAHPDDRAVIMRNYRQFVNEESRPDKYHFRLITGDGAVLWLEIRSAHITWDSGPALLVFVNDITDWIHGRDRLEREKEKISEECRSAKERLSIMCCDISDDLDAVCLKCAALSKELRNVDPEDYSSRISEIIENVEHISSMVRVNEEG